MPTICVDFDGVIHAYSRGWADGTIYDPPLPGAFEGLHCLMQYAAVVIHTTRDAQQVADWLFEHGDFNITWEESGAPTCEFWNDQTRLLVTSRKLPAVAYLDDRAVRFTSWVHAVDETLLAAGLHPGPHDSPEADDPIISAIKAFDFGNYGLDETDPTSEYAEWVPDLAKAIRVSLGLVTTEVS